MLFPLTLEYIVALIAVLCQAIGRHRAVDEANFIYFIRKVLCASVCTAAVVLNNADAAQFAITRQPPSSVKGWPGRKNVSSHRRGNLPTTSTTRRGLNASRRQRHHQRPSAWAVSKVPRFPDSKLMSDPGEYADGLGSTLCSKAKFPGGMRVPSAAFASSDRFPIAGSIWPRQSEMEATPGPGHYD